MRFKDLLKEAVPHDAMKQADFSELAAKLRREELRIDRAMDVHTTAQLAAGSEDVRMPHHWGFMAKKHLNEAVKTLLALSKHYEKLGVTPLTAADKRRLGLGHEDQ